LTAIFIRDSGFFIAADLICGVYSIEKVITIITINRMIKKVIKSMSKSLVIAITFMLYYKGCKFSKEFNGCQ